MDLSEFVKALATGGFGAVIAFLGKWLFEQKSAQLTARRKFTEKVTDEISALARDYYWKLANHTSVVAGQLEGYLQNRTYFLLLLPEPNYLPDRDWLKTQLEKLAEESAKSSFGYFCRTRVLFNEFQFGKGNTYLLTNRWAGDSLKRLYNRFVEATQEIDADGEILQLLDPKTSDWLEFSQTVSSPKLQTVQANYKKWLLKGAEDVQKAAGALQACSELLNSELTQLYGDWFEGKSRKIPSPLPDDLSEQSRTAIDRARYQSALLNPVGGTYVKEAPAGPEIERKAEHREKPIKPNRKPKISPPPVPRESQAVPPSAGAAYPRSFVTNADQRA